MQIKKIGAWFLLTLIVFSYLLLTQFLHEDRYLGLITPPKQLCVKIKYPLNLPMIQYYQNQNKTAIIFPIGRPLSLESDLLFSLDKDTIYPQIIFGPCGGYWVNMTFKMLSSASTFSIDRTLTQKSSTYYHEVNINHSKWTDPSPFIDSDEEIIRQVAENLTESVSLVSEKARIMNSFVHKYVKYSYSEDIEPPENASQTYFSRKGRCRHYARLFVAFCRGIGIPARTIGGRILTDTSPTADYHLWAEFYDETNHWVPVDPTHGYFNFSNTRFLDLSFARYQHPFNSSEAFFSNNTTLVGVYGPVEIAAVSFSIQNIFEMGFIFSTFIIISILLAFIPIDLVPSFFDKLIEKRREEEVIELENKNKQSR